ncbi:C-terminal binding protein [Streptomyces phyllanthi]|uniref:C-terminal binding protein n=1 Tax=Streptomyces phyllanthi TaxID=1803180 RepID=A0A5N8VTN9_9ACTN|nr:C-terminal binding protein [Streptomyces phyllanthi]MPY38603.1 C-terminal binding protein [Streptomyces phyllanthi]
MSDYRVVYTDPAWALDEHGEVDPRLAGIEHAALPGDARLDLGLMRDGAFVTEGPEFLEWIAGADAVVVYRAQVTEELADVLAGTCKVVARQGVGVDNLNAPVLARRGIPAFNVPDYCVDEVVTHTMALLLALERHICVQNQAVKEDRWNIFTGGRPRRLQELTAGLVGFGRIGRAVSRRLTGFYGRVVAYDPWVHADLMIGHGVRKAHSLEELLTQSDAVLLHAALDDSSRFLINETSLAHLRPGAVLVNAARGGLVRPEAVLEALRGGRLNGYAADVFTPEDPNRSEVNREILKFDNVVVSSHRAFLSEESEVSQRTRVAEEVAHTLTTGEPPRFGRVV